VHRVCEFIEENYDGDRAVPLKKIVMDFRARHPDLEYSGAERKVRSIIANAPREGIPIGSYPAGGYIYARTQEDRDLIVAGLKSRIGKLQERLNDFEKTFDNWPYAEAQPSML